MRVNGARQDNPAKKVAAGDVLTIAAPHVTAVVRIVSAGKRRGPAPEARLLYRQLGSDDAALVTAPPEG